jgi:Uma2 family endonuclease
MVQSAGDMELAADLAPRTYTVAEYNVMAKAGIFAPDERVELLDGQVIPMPPMGAAHRTAMRRIQARMHEVLGRRATIATQLPLVISERSEPEPDFAILRPRDDFYASGEPAVADVYAVVEVTDSSSTRDRVKKYQLYAQARIPEYWIVGLRDGSIDVFRESHDLGYAISASYVRGRTVSFAALPDAAFAVEDLIG